MVSLAVLNAAKSHEHNLAGSLPAFAIEGAPCWPVISPAVAWVDLRYERKVPHANMGLVPLARNTQPSLGWQRTFVAQVAQLDNMVVYVTTMPTWWIFQLALDCWSGVRTLHAEFYAYLGMSLSRAPERTLGAVEQEGVDKYREYICPTPKDLEAQRQTTGANSGASHGHSGRVCGAARRGQGQPVGLSLRRKTARGGDPSTALDPRCLLPFFWAR